MARKKKTEAAKGASSKSAPPVKIEPYMANLKCILTKDEVADRADRAAGLLQDRDAKEEDQKARAKAAKAEIDAVEAELRRVSNEVRTKATYQDVQCERRYVYDKSKVQEWRLDTGEMISERDMNEAEKQRELPFDDDGKGGAAGGITDLDDEFGGPSDDSSGKKAAE